MLKMTIDNEEVLSNNDISIKEEILSPSSTILNNVYPKSWEQDKDYTSRFYYPKDYSKLNIQNFNIEPEEAGKTIQVNGSATLTDVDTSKESRVLRILGQTSQTGTPSPSSPIPVNVVSGDNEIEVCGKNLLPTGTPFYGGANQWYDLYGNVMGTLEQITVNSNYIILQPNATYKLFAHEYNNIATMQLIYIDSNNTIKTYVNSSVLTGVATFTTTEYTKVWLRVKATTSAENTYFIGQLEKGSASTTYEPYIGNSYPIYLGVENLFDKNNVNELDAYISGSGVITGNVGDKTIYVPCEPNTTYTIQKMLCEPTSINKFRVCTTSNIPTAGTTGSDYIGYSTGTTVTQITITTSNNARYLCVFLYNRDATTTWEQMKDSIIINKGSLPYHVSTQPIELCKIGDYQDYIYKDNGSWYLHKEIKKIILDSTDGTASWNSWSMATTSNVIRFSRQNWLSDINTTTDQVVCSHFKYDGTNYNINTIIRYNRGLTITLSSSNDLGISDVETFKTWLGTNKPIVYYPLATPTNTEITDTTLLEQLESLSS